MVAAFGSGAMFSLVSGMGGANQAANAITSGLFFALVQGGLFQVSFKRGFHLFLLLQCKCLGLSRAAVQVVNVETATRWAV